MRKTIALMVLLSIIAISLVQAGTFSAPVGGAEICGASVTFTYVTTLSDTTNVTLWRSLANGSLPWTNIASAPVNTTANQSSFSIVYDTTGLTDSLTYKFNLTATDGSGFESGYINNSNVDNTGPVLSFAAANTIDKDYVYSEDFYISITSDENLGSAPTVSFKDQQFTLSGSAAAYVYDFGVNALRDDTYVYSIVGTDNTSCANQGTPISREVNIYSKSSAGAVKAAQEGAAQAAQSQQSKTVAVVIIAGAVYMMFFRQGGKRKK